MVNLMRVEFTKLAKSFDFKMLMLADIFLCVLLTLILLFLVPATSAGEARSTGYAVFLESLTQVQSNLIFWAIFAGLFICSDFVNRTLGLFIATGKSRISVFVSKMAAFFVGSAIITLIMPIFMTLFCTLANGFGQEFNAAVLLSMVEKTLLYLLVNLSIASICALIAYLCKNVGITIGISIGSILVLLTVSQLPVGTTVNALLRYTVFGQASLVPMIETQSEMILAVCVSVVTLAASMFATYLSFKKAELK